MLTATIRQHPVVAVLGAFALTVVIGVPLVAFLVIPTFVKSTLAEDLPNAAAGSTAAANLETLAKGELVKISIADYGSGVVRIVRLGNERFVSFENVAIAGAPDVYVYLSDRADGTPGAFADLGKLKATNGSFNYAIPASLDLAKVRSVLLWCRQFAVTITYAVLQAP